MRRCLLAAVLVGCSITESDRRAPHRFELLDPARTGVDFNNTIATTDSLNFQRDAYVYNGAGVGVGDINNDGLPDIFFAGNTVSSRLYLNKGGMRFTDVTAKAGVATDRWATGVAMVDINNDGYLDIYVSVSGPPWTPAAKRGNLLFVNNGNGTFTESAAKYGIADTGFTTQSVFFDYNGDNCLDLFVLNASPEGFNRIKTAEGSGFQTGTIGSYNTLYRNNCDGTFTDVSREAGILRDAGFGLGVAIADLNQDGWPDIYVSNDIAPNDLVYMNNGDGTFTNKRSAWFKHTSYSGMGVDIADINNDGWPDVFQVDMLPRDLSQRKRTTGSMTFAAQTEARRLGYLDDYTTNTLQLSNGISRGGDPVFSDIARLAGVAATDWSWAPLIADFDNDGNKDLFVSNGYPKAVNDRDYVLPALSANQPFGGKTQRSPREMLNALYAYHVPNYVFRNLGDLTFRDESEAWGINQPSFSYGAAYADLDNDGRLDVVVNNMNAPAFIYHNTGSTDSGHYLTVTLQGDPPNRDGIGSQLMLRAGGKKQYLYQSPYRGYMSTVDMRPHFGLGSATKIDTLEIEWPDGRRQVLTNLQADRLIILRQGDATPGKPAPLVSAPPRQRFATVTLPGLPHADSAPPPLDFMVQPMLPYAISQHGPPIAVADVNGDGLDDIFIGANRAGVGGRLFIQQPNGAFVESRGQPWEVDKSYEDWGAVFFDANGDGRPDLYVASGGYGLAPSSSLLQDRLYLNVGKGRFVRDEKALPPMLASKSVVRVGDFNGDGRPDLFVGGRLTPRSYPYPTRSFILRNDGGRFTDVTKDVAPELIDPGGMITDAEWIDFDGDGRLDLVTVGEWMPVNFYHNDGSRLRNTTTSTGLPPLRGWWYSLTVGDFDGDRRPDIVAGNLGLNYSYTTAVDSAFGVYAGDFTGDRKIDVILTKSIKGIEYPFEGLAPLGWQMYPLAIQFPTYGSFATAPMTAVLGDKERQHALHYNTDTFESVFLHNDGNGRFSAHPLPKLAQISPLRAMFALDVDGDGNLDLVATGNLSDAEPNTAPADAGNGLWLKGDGKGRFFPVPAIESGFLTPLAASGIALVRTAKGRVVVVTNVNDSLQSFRIRGH